MLETFYTKDLMQFPIKDDEPDYSEDPVSESAMW